MSGKGLVIGKISIFPVLVIIILSTIGYQEAYATITYQSTIGVTGVFGTDNSHFNVLSSSVKIDSAGKIYVADEDNHRIQIFDSTGTYQSTIGVTGIPGNDVAHLNFPDDVTADSSGNIYVADTDNHRIQIFDSTGTYQSTLGVTGVIGNDNAHLKFPGGVAVSSGKIYVADTGNHRIQIFDSTGTYQSTLGVTGVPGNDVAHLNFPDDVTADSSGNIYVADTDNHRVQIFDSTGTYQSTIGVTGVIGNDNAHLKFPGGVAVSSGKIYVADTGNHRIQIFDSTGTYQSTLGVAGITGTDNAHFNAPSGVTLDSSGNIYVADTGNHRVQIFDSTGIYKSTLGVSGVSGSDNSHFNSPNRVAVDSAGNIYVADTSNHRIQIFDLTGAYMTTIGETGVFGSDNSHFNSPTGIAVDSAGNIYVADDFNFRVQVFTGPPTPLNPSGTLGHYSGDNPPSSRLKPSFGGTGNMVFADGLTLDGKVYDIGNFKQTIPKNIADVGQPITIIIKEQLAYGPQDWKYVAVYMNFGGKDPETYNARLILSNDKNDGQKIVDPNGYIKDYTVTTETNAPYVFTTFSFTVAKAMADTSMIVTGWDSHNRVNNVYVGGAIQFGKDPIIYPQTIPPSLHIYTNVRDADFAVENAGYVKPELFAHISNTVQMWNEPNTGHVRWFFDSALGQVAILSYDKKGDMVWHKEQVLKRDQVVLRASYSGQHLDRTKEMEMKSAKSAEELRSVQTLERLNFHN